MGFFGGYIWTIGRSSSFGRKGGLGSPVPGTISERPRPEILSLGMPKGRPFFTCDGGGAILTSSCSLFEDFGLLF